VPRVGPRLAAAIRAIDLSDVQSSIERWQRQGLQLLTLDHPAYPSALRAVEDAPPLLFERGSSAPADAPAIAIVGTRLPSSEARSLAREAAAALASQGWTIVSGLASGIDAASHRGALEAGGRTLAVLGSGVQCIYPHEHRALAAQIVGQGALLSEVAPGTRPTSTTLVARNRLISGLSRAVVVVEAGAGSGSLYAAQFARKQGRLVYAAPSKLPGVLGLLAEGAQPLSLSAERWPEQLEFLREWG
jgi:DNA processing protein